MGKRDLTKQETAAAWIEAVAQVHAFIKDQISHGQQIQIINMSKDLYGSISICSTFTVGQKEDRRDFTGCLGQEAERDRGWG